MAEAAGEKQYSEYWRKLQNTFSTSVMRVASSQLHLITPSEKSNDAWKALPTTQL